MRKKVFMFLIPILLASFIILSVGGYKFASESLKNSNLEIMKEMTRVASSKVYDKVQNEIKDIEILSCNPIIKDEKIDMKEKIKFLQPYLGQKGIVEMIIGDTEGNIIDTSGKESNTKVFQGYIKAMQGESSITNTYVDPEKGKTLIKYSTPIKNDNNSIIGYIVLTKDCNDFSTLKDQIKFLSTGSLLIVDSFGNIIVSNEDTLMKDNTNITDMKAENDSLDELNNIGKNIITSTECQVGKFNYNNSTRYISYMPIGDTGLFIGITVEEKNLFDALKNLKNVDGILTIIMICVIGIIIVISLFGVTKKLTIAKEYVDTIGKGDLKSSLNTKLFKSKDEITDICKSVNNAKKSMADMIRTVKENAGEVKSQSSYLLNISSELASHTNEITSSINNVAKHINEENDRFEEIIKKLNLFSEKINLIKDDVNLINKSVSMVNDKANDGNENMEKLKTKVNKINEIFFEFCIKVDEVGKQMITVNNITDMIDEIADETDLLALNAAIEAAKAGESGRGFNVVAGEIRNLAEQSKKSSQNISKIINSLMSMIREIINNSKKMKDELQEQGNIIYNVLESFMDINGSVNEIAPRVTKMNSEFVVIIDNKEKIVSTINKLSEMVSETAKASYTINVSSVDLSNLGDEVNKASEFLLRDSENLMKEVFKFQI